MCVLSYLVTAYVGKLYSATVPDPYLLILMLNLDAAVIDWFGWLLCTQHSEHLPTHFYGNQLRNTHFHDNQLRNEQLLHVVTDTASTFNHPVYLRSDPVACVATVWACRALFYFCLILFGVNKNRR